MRGHTLLDKVVKSGPQNESLYVSSLGCGGELLSNGTHDLDRHSGGLGDRIGKEECSKLRAVKLSLHDGVSLLSAKVEKNVRDKRLRDQLRAGNTNQASEN